MKGKSKKSKNQKAAQESNAAAASSEATTIEQYAPVDGSWIAELDDAKDELKGVLKMPGGVDKNRGDALRAYLFLKGAGRVRLLQQQGSEQRWRRRQHPHRYQ
jgi:hypothetical protein